MSTQSSPYVSPFPGPESDLASPYFFMDVGSTTYTIKSGEELKDALDAFNIKNQYTTEMCNDMFEYYINYIDEIEATEITLGAFRTTEIWVVYTPDEFLASELHEGFSEEYDIEDVVNELRKNGNTVYLTSDNQVLALVTTF